MTLNPHDYEDPDEYYEIIYERIREYSRESHKELIETLTQIIETYGDNPWAAGLINKK